MLQRNDSVALTDRLIRARQKYNKQVNAVLDTVVERREAIGETITDLNTEDAALAKVQREAESK